MATVPHILAPAGNKKLSKRDGSKDVLDYIREGFLPEALVNFIASLGWNDGTEQEIFSRDELVQKFSLNRVQRSGARFDEQRLLWMNGAWIRQKGIDELYQLTDKPEYWPLDIPAEYNNRAYKIQVLAIIQERLKYFGELPSLTPYFFVDLPLDATLISTHKQLKKFSSTELTKMLEQVRSSLVQSDFSPADLQTKLNDLLEQTGQKPAVLFSLIRIASTQAPASPGLADTLAVLGKERSLRRIDTQLAALTTS
jgi:glutamyl/glutaminyl-tRNA synthetase